MTVYVRVNESILNLKRFIERADISTKYFFLYDYVREGYLFLRKDEANLLPLFEQKKDANKFCGKYFDQTTAHPISESIVTVAKVFKKLSQHEQGKALFYICEYKEGKLCHRPLFRV